MQKLLSSTLSSHNNGGRNHSKDLKRSSKKQNRTRQHSANPKLNHSKNRKSPNRGRNDCSFNFKTAKLDDKAMLLNLMKNSIKESKPKHKKKKSSINASNIDRVNAVVHSINPQKITYFNVNTIKKLNAKNLKITHSPKRGIKCSKALSKGGSIRNSRKGSSNNSNERMTYATFASQRVSPNSRKKQPSFDYNLTSNCNLGNMTRDMGMSFSSSNMHSKPEVKARQRMIGSKKSSLINSVIGNVNKARERAHQMYMSGTIHAPTPSKKNFIFIHKFLIFTEHLEFHNYGLFLNKG